MSLASIPMGGGTEDRSAPLTQNSSDTHRLAAFQRGTHSFVKVDVLEEAPDALGLLDAHRVQLNVLAPRDEMEVVAVVNLKNDEGDDDSCYACRRWRPQGGNERNSLVRLTMSVEVEHGLHGAGRLRSRRYWRWEELGGFFCGVSTGLEVSIAFKSAITSPGMLRSLLLRSLRP